MMSFQLPAKQLIRFGERHRNGMLYGQGCVALTAEQIHNGVPLTVEWTTEIGRAIPSLNRDGVSFVREVHNTPRLLGYWDTRDTACEWSVRFEPLEDDDWEFRNDKPVIVHAVIRDVALLPMELAVPRMRAVS
jgi:hypothetical protein